MPSPVAAALAELAAVPTDLLRDTLAAETDPALAWLIRVELNRRMKARPWWDGMPHFTNPKDN